MSRCIACSAVFALLAASLSGGTFAQDRDRNDRDRDGERQERDDSDRRDRDSGDRRDRDDGDRSDRRRGEDRGRDFDPGEVVRMADNNKDGMIDPSEVSNRSGYFIRRAAERAGIDMSKPVAVNQLLPALEAVRGERGSSSSTSSSNVATSQPAGTPVVAGFGQADATPKAVGFNVPLTVNAAAPIAQRFDQRVIDYVNEMLRERDVNKNGVLEKSEWTGRWSTPAADSDTNKDGILDMQELCVRISNRYNVGRPGSTPTSTASSPSSPSALTPAAASSPTPASSTSSNDSDRFRRYAEGFLRQYDANKDGKLDKDESSKMRPEHQAADANKDGIITLEELQARLQGYAASAPGSSSSDRDRNGDEDRGRRYGSRRGDSSDKSADTGPRKSYRISSSTERLPKGLPDWFLRSDTDADGQVSMAEFTTSWTEQLAAEFAKNDLNGDGIITPDECLPDAKK